MYLKHLLFLSFIFIFQKTILAQCGDRYTEKIFTTVNSTIVSYGSNTTVGGILKDLKMTIYEPVGDTFQIRPVMIFAHGGSFISGDRNSAELVYLCTEFAKRGYVCASIDYRLMDVLAVPDSVLMFNVVVKTIGDMKAAIRYFRKDFSTTNIYKADTSQIFIGGTSAGAVVAINTSYIDDPAEAPTYIQTIIANNGGLEGTSGNDGYSSKAKAIINICGAVGKKGWIDAQDEPIISFHGTEDDVVPYANGWAKVGTFNVAKVDGSSIIHQYCDSLGIPNFFRSFSGAGHVPFNTPGATGIAYLDTIEQDIENFIAPLTVCNTTVSILENSSQNLDFIVFPNPANEYLNISLDEIKSFTIFNTLGKSILIGTENSIDISKLSAGMYYIHVEDDDHKIGIKKFFVK